MKKFILKIIYLSLPILVIAIVMEMLLRNIPNDYLLKSQYLDKHSSEIETLILGSSHAFYGLNPEYFSSKTFNAANIAQTLNYDYEIIKKYQDNFKNLKTIVLPISYFTLYKKLETAPESWRVKNYMIYYKMHCSKSITYYSEVLCNRIYINIIRLISYYVFGDPTISCSDLGWGNTYNSKNAKDLVKTGKDAARRYTVKDLNSDMNQQIFKENVFILESILRWSKKNNIKILLFTPPGYKTYRENLNPVQMETTINTTREICSKFNNCIYINLQSDTNFVASDYYDGDHLSEIGAKSYQYS